VTINPPNSSIVPAEKERKALIGWPDDLMLAKKKRPEVRALREGKFGGISSGGVV
jgi:hypothetical protein